MRPFGWFYVLFGFFVSFFVVNISQAGVTTVQALSFGSFIIKNNDAQYDVIINTDSSFTFSAAGFLDISAPREGIYDLDGMPINTAIASVVITQVSSLAGAGGPDLQMLNFTETHSANTDPSGVARIEVGATARTNGTGMAYLDQGFTGSIQIQVNF